jgi:hypothetical protein
MPPENTHLSSKVEIRSSNIHGSGLFVVEHISKGDLIVRWGGDYVNQEQAAEAEAAGKLVMQWDNDLYSIEDRGEDDGYFINHSCNSNLWMDGAFSLVARTDISEGEEATADYALWEADKDYISKWLCKCGMADCRGRVTGTDWELRTIRDKYRNHFSPLINKRIELLEQS